MNPIFQVQSPAINTLTAALIVEISEAGFSFIVIDAGVCKAFAVYQFGDGNRDEATAARIHEVVASQPLLSQVYHKVTVVYGYTRAVLLPDELMNDNSKKAALELVYGPTGQVVILSDFIPAHNLHNVYKIPAVIDHVISRYFGAARYTHHYSLMPELVKPVGNQLYCVLGKGGFNIVLFKESKLQLVQHFNDRVPEDVIYHLANTCTSFEVNKDDTMVHLSGMIDASSSLYNELYKYFLHLSFGKLPEEFQYPAELLAQPEHYYSHLFEIAVRCV